MTKIIRVSLIFIFLVAITGKAQKNSEVFTTKFVLGFVTYNGSPNPNECWEAVERGIKIKTEKTTYFFTVPNTDINKLKEKIGDSEVEITVNYFNEPLNDSEAMGCVSKITLKGEVIFENK